MDKLLGTGLKEIAGGGFCVMDAGTMPSDGPILVVHIVNDMTETLGSVFPMELISIVAALRLTKGVMGLRKLYSDSKAALTLLAKPDWLPYWSRKDNLAVLQAGVMLSKGRTLEHVRSHVEQRKPSRSSWLPSEWGNWIADKIASGVEASLDGYEVRWVEVKCSKILSDICEDGMWHLTALDGVVALASPEKTIMCVNNSEYLEKRDYEHAKRLNLSVDPPALYWRDASVAFAAKAWGMAHRSIPMAARAQRVIFDKLWFSWNVAKGVPGTEVVCPLCGQDDSLSHLIQRCPAASCAIIRNEGIEAIDELAILLDPASKWLSNTLVQMATTNPHGSLIFMGMWNSVLKNNLKSLITQSGYHINDVLLNQWRIILGDVSHSLVLLTRALVADRIAGPDGPLPVASVGEKISDDRRARTTRRTKEKSKAKPSKSGVEDDNLGQRSSQAVPTISQSSRNLTPWATRTHHTNACNILK